MLQRPEIGTREHILLWLGSKPRNEKFPYFSSKHCACGQYCQEVYGHWALWLSVNKRHVWDLNRIAGLVAATHGYREMTRKQRIEEVLPTFGEVYDAACKAWAE